MPAMANLEVIHELYRAFATKDYPAFLALCQPDLVWIQNEGFPNGKTHHGPQAVVDDVFKTFNDSWADWKFTIEEYLDAGAAIIVIGRYEGAHRLTGKAFTARAAHVYDLREGKLTRFRQFTDTKVIWDAMK